MLPRMSLANGNSLDEAAACAAPSGEEQLLLLCRSAAGLPERNRQTIYNRIAALAWRRSIAFMDRHVGG